MINDDFGKNDEREEMISREREGFIKEGGEENETKKTEKGNNTERK